MPVYYQTLRGFTVGNALFHLMWFIGPHAVHLVSSRRLLGISVICNLILKLGMLYVLRTTKEGLPGTPE